MSNLANFLLFQAAWFACVLGAAEGLVWAGPAAALLFLALHFVCFVRERAREGLLVVGVAAGGCALSGFNVANGSVTFLAADPGLLGVPLWIAALWASFAMILRHSLGWMRGRFVPAAMAGLIGSPLSYRAAEGLGALELHDDPLRGLLVVGVTWAVAVPLCVLAAGPPPTEDPAPVDTPRL